MWRAGRRCRSSSCSPSRARRSRRPQLEAVAPPVRAAAAGHRRARRARDAKQGVDRIGSVEDAAPLLFDHRVYKSYPMSIIEKRQFDRLTQWLRRLTTHDRHRDPARRRHVRRRLDRAARPLRDDHAPLDRHHRQAQLPAALAQRVAGLDGVVLRRDPARPTGVDRRKEALPSFYPAIAPATRPARRCSGSSASSPPRARRAATASTSTRSRPTCSRSPRACARPRSAASSTSSTSTRSCSRSGKKLIEAGRRRDAGPRASGSTSWPRSSRGRRVRVSGVTGDLVRLALKGQVAGRQVRLRPRLGPVHERRPQGPEGRARGLGAAAPATSSASSASRASTA